MVLLHPHLDDGIPASFGRIARPKVNEKKGWDRPHICSNCVLSWTLPSQTSAKQGGSLERWENGERRVSKSFPGNFELLDREFSRSLLPLRGRMIHSLLLRSRLRSEGLAGAREQGVSHAGAAVCEVLDRGRGLGLPRPWPRIRRARGGRAPPPRPGELHQQDGCPAEFFGTADGQGPTALRLRAVERGGSPIDDDQAALDAGGKKTGAWHKTLRGDDTVRDGAVHGRGDGSGRGVCTSSVRSCGHRGLIHGDHRDGIRRPLELVTRTVRAWTTPTTMALGSPQTWT